MTTLVAIQQPLQLLSMSDQPVRRSKRQPGTLAPSSPPPPRQDRTKGKRSADGRTAAADYEQDDDFHFVRKSKKAKTEEKQQPPEPVAPPPPSSLPVRKSTRGRPAAKKDRAVKEVDAGVNATEDDAMTTTATTTTTKTTTTRKSSRRKPSIDASHDEPPLKVVKRVTRRSARLSSEAIPVQEPPAPAPAPAPAPQPRTNGTSRSNGRTKEKAATPPEPIVEESPIHEESVESAKIALPMSDTPIINRNKEMRRKGGTSNRRSSLGSRGRRASSLIESGQAAIPHREVNPAEFFKHIEAEGLPEPRRMKQLLMWCGERALAAKPRHGNSNSGAILGARAIQDQLLKDFASKSECSDWFNREEDIPKAPVILQPNPRNIELDEKMKTLEAKIKRLQEEKKSWLAIRKPPPEQPPIFTPEEAEKIILPEFDLLDLEEGKIRGYLADETNSFAALRSKTETRLRRTQSSLEFEVDQLADNVHKLEQRLRVAGKEADWVLALSSKRLKEREEREKKSAGTKDLPIMEVLRSLSSILPEGGG
ncbi:Kinetochore protein mis13 [Cladobotryum mycophilum]|uniref:Kinetochore protein mis13 n=1 Tax=Cladobotryum mycophilum TaxID=491253 RepID=A0ABR0S4K3_9HYPO